MPDTAPMPPLPDADDDRLLLQLGAEHRVLLDAYRALCRTQPIADEPLDRLTEALTGLEERVAGLPAHSASGLLVRLRVLWAALDHTEASLFGPPGAGAGIVHRLVWGAREDARRLAGRCREPGRCSRRLAAACIADYESQSCGAGVHGDALAQPQRDSG